MAEFRRKRVIDRGTIATTTVSGAEAMPIARLAPASLAECLCIRRRRRRRFCPPCTRCAISVQSAVIIIAASICPIRLRQPDRGLLLNSTDSRDDHESLRDFRRLYPDCRLSISDTLRHMSACCIVKRGSFLCVCVSMTTRDPVSPDKRAGIIVGKKEDGKRRSAKFISQVNAA